MFLGNTNIYQGLPIVFGCKHDSDLVNKDLSTSIEQLRTEVRYSSAHYFETYKQTEIECRTFMYIIRSNPNFNKTN